MFLLKGHEDLRQDERVMQLFGLVNTLLLNDPKTFRHNLTIQVRKRNLRIRLIARGALGGNAPQAKSSPQKNFKMPREGEKGSILPHFDSQNLDLLSKHFALATDLMRSDFFSNHASLEC